MMTDVSASTGTAGQTDGRIDERMTIRELLRRHPEALRVLLRHSVPVACAEGTIADAARACGMAPGELIAQIVRARAASL
jgi:hypothetical protein